MQYMIFSSDIQKIYLKLYKQKHCFIQYVYTRKPIPCLSSLCWMVLQDEEMQVLVSKLGMNLEAGQWEGLKYEWMMTFFTYIYIPQFKTASVYLLCLHHFYSILFAMSIHHWNDWNHYGGFNWVAWVWHKWLLIIPAGLFLTFCKKKRTTSPIDKSISKNTGRFSYSLAFIWVYGMEGAGVIYRVLKYIFQYMDVFILYSNCGHGNS